MVPHNPRPYDELRARFPKCLSRILELKEIIESITDPNRPSNDQDHVFDTYDGYRLIVTFESLDGKPSLHVSVSGWNPQAKRRLAKDKGYVYSLRAFKRIAGLVGATRSYAACFRSPAGFIHMRFPLDGELLRANSVPTEDDDGSLRRN